MSLEPSDLNVQLNFALVCSGKMCDFLKLRDQIHQNYPEVKIIFNTMSADYLFILKKNNLTPDQVKLFQKEKSKGE